MILVTLTVGKLIWMALLYLLVGQSFCNSLHKHRQTILTARHGFKNRMYTESKKMERRNLVNNFDKCWPILKIFSLLHSHLNLQQTDYSLPTIPETCSYYTWHKQRMLILLLYKHNKCKRMRF